MYWNAIIWFLSWPVLIVIAWIVVRLFLTKYGHVLNKQAEE